MRRENIVLVIVAIIIVLMGVNTCKRQTFIPGLCGTMHVGAKWESIDNGHQQLVGTMGFTHMGVLRASALFGKDLTTNEARIGVEAAAALVTPLINFTTSLRIDHGQHARYKVGIFASQFFTSGPRDLYLTQYDGRAFGPSAGVVYRYNAYEDGGDLKIDRDLAFKVGMDFRLNRIILGMHYDRDITLNFNLLIF